MVVGPRVKKLTWLMEDVEFIGVVEVKSESPPHPLVPVGTLRVGDRVRVCLVVENGTVESTPAYAEVHVRNEGTADLVIHGSRFVDTRAFRVGRTSLPLVVPAGQSRPVGVFFLVGDARGNLDIESNDQQRPKVNVVLRGEGP